MPNDRIDFAVLNASQLITVGEGSKGPRRGREQGEIDYTENGALVASGGRIVAVGPTDRIRAQHDLSNANVIDATGKIVLPGLVDSHTHPLFAGSRHDEYAERLAGAEMADVAARGGGIWWSVVRTRAASTEELEQTLERYFRDMLSVGTTAIEAKSGYGQTPDEEIRELQIIGDVAKRTPLRVAPTFLGAHVVPKEHETAESYADEIINEMLPRVVEQGIARFCDTSLGDRFTPEIATRIIRAAADVGLPPRVHTDGQGGGDGWAVAAENGAVTADHLTATRREVIHNTGPTDTIAVVIPPAELYYLWKQRAPVRDFIDNDVAVAVSTDFCSSIDAPSLFSLIPFAAPWYRMTPEEVISAVTINPAYSIGMGSDIGSLDPGKQADLIVVDAPNYRKLIFEFGMPRISSVVVGGNVVGPAH